MSKTQRTIRRLGVSVFCSYTEQGVIAQLRYRLRPHGATPWGRADVSELRVRFTGDATRNTPMGPTERSVLLRVTGDSRSHHEIGSHVTACRSRSAVGQYTSEGWCTDRKCVTTGRKLPSISAG